MIAEHEQSTAPPPPGGVRRDEQIDWFMTYFIPDPGCGHALLNPPGAHKPRSRKRGELRQGLVTQALAGARRRLQVSGRWPYVPTSLAVVPAHRAGWARVAVIDLGAAEVETIAQLQRRCADLGLWTVAEIGTGATAGPHTGSTLWVPMDTPQDVALLDHLAAALAQSPVSSPHQPPAPSPQARRLPLMLDLRAPGGPRRPPLLLPDGVWIDTADPWEALAALHAAWRPNTLATLAQTLVGLPRFPERPSPQATHRSKVRPGDLASVRRWWNQHHPLRAVLTAIAGGPVVDGPVVPCPLCGEREPSLVIWQTTTKGRPLGYQVCRCAQAGCPAAGGLFWDAFDLETWRRGLPPDEAAVRLVGEHRLGEMREFVLTSMVRHPQPNDLGVSHLEQINMARGELARSLAAAAGRRGQVTIIGATPGLGKTFAAAQLAQARHAGGEVVAIAAPSHALAEEWRGLLPRAMVFQPRVAICTCLEPGQLAAAEQGHPLPPCRPGCPYERQRRERAGRIVIYQHNHLWLQGGALLADADLVIVDESPLGAMLQTRQVRAGALGRLVRQLEAAGGRDPALPLLGALRAVGMRDMSGRESLRGQTLIEALAGILGGGAAVATALADAHHSPLARPARQPPAPSAQPQMLGLLRALAHDLANPDGNILLAFAREGAGGWGWVWYEKHPLLERARGRERPPAVIVLDGSADQAVYAPLCAPWPVEVVPIAAPLAPSVTVVQCGVTASTRRILHDPAQLDRVIRAVALACLELEVRVDGGVSYKGAAPALEQAFGGTWLHYGGQRGANALKDTRVLALVASPTAPPDALERQAMALWQDGPPIDATWERMGSGAFRALDPRLEALNRLAGPEELRQAAHRCRPILSEHPTTLIVFSPWDLTGLGLPPHLVITELPHGRRRAVQEALGHYRAKHGLDGAGGQPASDADERADEEEQEVWIPITLTQAEG